MLGRTFRRCSNNNNDKSKRHENVHSILANLVKEEMNYKKEKKIEELKRKVDIIEGKKREIEEKHNAESATADMMKRLIHDLNKDHMRCIEMVTRKMKHENYTKLNKKDQEIKKKNERI